MPPGGLNFEELVSRFSLFMKCEPFRDVLDRMNEGLCFRSDTPEKRLLLELVRRDMAKFIAESPFSIDVPPPVEVPLQGSNQAEGRGGCAIA